MPFKIFLIFWPRNLSCFAHLSHSPQQVFKGRCLNKDGLGPAPGRLREWRREDQCPALRSPWERGTMARKELHSLSGQRLRARSTHSVHKVGPRLRERKSRLSCSRRKFRQPRFFGSTQTNYRKCAEMKSRILT